jgi:hypothetical protein
VGDDANAWQEQICFSGNVFLWRAGDSFIRKTFSLRCLLDLLRIANEFREVVEASYLTSNKDRKFVNRIIGL